MISGSGWNVLPVEAQEAGTATPLPSGGATAVDPQRWAQTTTNAAGPARTGWYPQMPELAPESVTAADFGVRWKAQLDGQILAQPVAWNGVVVVATAANIIAALDVATGAQRWSRSLGSPVLAEGLRCTDLVPTIGVTSTPVIDPSTGTVFALTKTGIDGRYAHQLHALDVMTGEPRSNFPVTLGGTAANDPTQTFESTWQHQRPGLLLLDGVIYAGFGAHCDLGRYKGWIIGIRTTGEISTLWSAYAAVPESGAGIWQSGSAPASDGPGRMFVTTGNGFGARSGQLGGVPPAQLAQSVVRLDVQPDGSLKAADFFSPYDAPSLDIRDGDLGASSPMVLPESFGGRATPRLLFQSSKTAYSYLLNRDDLGGRGTGRNGSDRVVSRIGPDGGQWGKSTAWSGQGGWIYSVTNTRGNNMYAYQVVSDANGRSQLVRRAVSNETFGKLSGTPVVTSNGTTAGSAVVWAIHRGASANSSTLRAFAATPKGGRLQMIWSGAIGNAAKFSSPLPVSGQIIVATADGTVISFARPSALAATAAEPEAATPVNAVTADPDVISVGAVATGAQTTAVVSITNNTPAPVTVSAITVRPAAPTTAAEVTVTSGPPVGSVLAPGQSVAVTVTIVPARSGDLSATVDVVTTGGTASVLVTAASGRQAKLVVAPIRVDLGTVKVGSAKRGSFQLANRGGAPLTITRSKGPASAAGWSIVADLAEGTVLAPGDAKTVTVELAPRTPGPVTGTWRLNGDAPGSSATITFTARAMP
jgi:hypothetical protein